MTRRFATCMVHAAGAHRPSLTVCLAALFAILSGVVDHAVRADELRQGPRILRGGDREVGQLAEPLAGEDVRGKKFAWPDLADKKLVVVAMTSTSCPISKKYLPTLVELAKTYRPRGVQFILVNPVPTDSQEDCRAAAETCGDAATYVHDPERKLAASVRAGTTTDVAVLDRSRTIVYHGAVDDQYGFGYSIDTPRRRYLADALDALLADRTPLVEATDSPGCEFEVEAAASGATAITYHGRVARILRRHCVECHREGGVGPFSLETVTDVESHATMIKRVVERGVMPPWFAANPAEGGASPWLNDRSLAPADRRDLLAWLNSDRPVGDARESPPKREFSSGWLIGEPDAIYQFETPVRVKATGTMPYQNVTVETGLEEDRWVQAIEVRPGNRAVVHHVLVFVRGADEADNGRENDEASGYWGIYVPGNSTLVYPEGYAKRIPRGARLRFQMHYTPNGTETEDRTQIGLVFAKQPPRHEVKVAGVVNVRLRIPPGAGNHSEVATLIVPADVQVLAFLPHMHLRGKAARYDFERAGTTTTLLDIPRYDFNWQLLYRFAEPYDLKRGDVLKFTAWYDNSPQNPANPDPTRTVRWGPQTSDEMHLGYVEYIVPGETPGEGGSRGIRRAGAAARLGNLALDVVFKSIDANADGRLSWDETRKYGESTARWKDNLAALEALFKRLDADSDGQLDRAEFDKLRRGEN